MQDFDVTVVTRGRVEESVKPYAVDKIRSVGKLAPRPVIFARVKLSHEENPAVARPAVAEATLDVSGQLLRAQVAAGTMTEAVDLVQGRLYRKLERLSGIWQARRKETGVAGDKEWRHGDRTSERPDFYPRPADERQLISHKSFGRRVTTPDEAAFDMEVLDYDFYLFTDAATGQDSIIYRRDDGSVGLRQASGAAVELGATAFEFRVDEIAAPTLTLEKALAMLDDGGEPFVFYLDADEGEGRAVYRRYDGHYGLITPAPE